MASETAPPASFIDPKYVLSGMDQQSTTHETSSSASNNADPQTSDQTAQTKKKRKSWGQVLPKPTTNLPPRKRAKTAEEKAQRHYERVQRNRQAAHNSRMRKQDEMDRVVSENNRLKQDVQHYQEEIKRLQEEVALYRGFQASSSAVHPLTPPSDYLSNFSENQQKSPEPSLTNGSSNSASSPPELADLATPSSPRSFNEPIPDMKQFNDSHSAVDVEFANYLEGNGHFDGSGMNLFSGYDFIQPVSQTSAMDAKVQFDDLLNLDGLENSSIPAPSANHWEGPASGFDSFGVQDFSLFPQGTLDLVQLPVSRTL